MLSQPSASSLLPNYVQAIRDTAWWELPGPEIQVFAEPSRINNSRFSSRIANKDVQCRVVSSTADGGISRRFSYRYAVRHLDTPKLMMRTRASHQQGGALGEAEAQTDTLAPSVCESALDVLAVQALAKSLTDR
jgi:hypothetical protein